MGFLTELKKLGLKDKEAAVYLSCLELGPSPVQNIARKAKVVRATTYVILESLLEKGLVTKYKEGKKTLFAAEPPRQLMRLLEKQKEDIDEKQHDLEVMLPELQVLMKASADRPTVRYFEGKEGLRAIRQEIIMHTKPGDMIYNFTPLDYLIAIFPENEEAFARQRIAKGIKARTLFTTKSATLRQKQLEPSSTSKDNERRYISSDFFSSTSGMTIYGNRVAMGNFTGKLVGVVVESAEMADMMRKMFELAWLGAEHIDEK